MKTIKVFLSQSGGQMSRVSITGLEPWRPQARDPQEGLEENLLVFSAVPWLLAFPGCGCITPFSASMATWPFPRLCVPHFLLPP